MSAEPQGSTTLGADVLGEEMGRQVARKKVMTEQELAKMQRVGPGMGRVALETPQCVAGIGDRRSSWGGGVS